MTSPDESKQNNTSDSSLSEEPNNKCMGYTLTGIYLFGLLVLMIVRWPELSSMKLNELGDFLAGAFGPLAFVWLVLGYFQQGRELRINSTALTDQAEELKQSVLQQKTLAEISQKQLHQLLNSHSAIISVVSLCTDYNEHQGEMKVRVDIANLGYQCTQLTVMINDAREYGINPTSGNFRIDRDIFAKSERINKNLLIKIPTADSQRILEIRYMDGTGYAKVRKFSLQGPKSDASFTEISSPTEALVTAADHPPEAAP